MFESADIIDSYSRAEALEDGMLVDVSEHARSLGVIYPIAMTHAAYEKYVAWDDSDNAREHALQDSVGHLHDVLWMFRLGARRNNGPEFCFSLRVVRRSYGTELVELSAARHDGVGELVKLRAVCGPGDTAEPVITIMLPEED